MSHLKYDILIGSFKLTCTVEGVPEPDIQWEKDGVPVTNENFPNVIFAKDSLLLSGVSREDEGTWTCIASNIAGSDSISHQLLIEWAPKVSFRTSSWKGELETNAGVLSWIDQLELESNQLV